MNHLSNQQMFCFQCEQPESAEKRQIPQNYRMN